jgi:hypothetical protein
MKSEKATYTGFEFEVENFPASAIINSSLKDFTEKELYSNAVFIAMVPDKFDEFGHPTPDEYDFLNTIEKEIIAYLESETRTIHVGHTTIYRARQIIFYTRDPEQVESYLDHYLPSTGRESGFEIESDPEWSNVSAFYELL